MYLDDFLELGEDELIESLDTYQQELVKDLIDNSNRDFKLAADKWLSASPSNTVPFGGEHNRSKIFREKIFEEFEKYICGCDDGRYDKDREMLYKQGDATKNVIISFVSAAIGGVLGVSASFIAPVIVLLLLSIGRISKNAWCEMMKEEKNISAT